VRRELTLVIGCLGTALIVVGFEFGDAWPYNSGLIVGCLGAAGTLLALWRQYLEDRPFEYQFTEAAWKPRGPDHQLCIQITGADHGKGRSPSVSIYAKDEATGRYEESQHGVEVEASSGTLSITASRGFSGKMIIR
jgi:hypothetical protein